MTVDFVIINYKSTMEIVRLLRDIEETCWLPYTVTVIDNTLDNRGFSVAANLGAFMGSGDLICFLNPDIHLVDDWLDETIDAFLSSIALAIAGPRLDDGFPWPRDVSRNHIKNWVCGACYFVRRPVFEKCGGFDERYFFTYEETDLIRQVEDMGYDVRSLNVENPTIKHIRHNTPFHDEQLAIGNRLFHEKWGY